MVNPTFRRRAQALSLTSAVVAAAVLATAALANAATSGPFRESFRWATAGSPWHEGHNYGRWNDEYNGLGRVTRANDRALGAALTLAPAVARSRSVTHAALVTSRLSFGNAATDVSVRTLQQLRTGSRPNAWEVGWILWHYRDNRHFYYLLLKPHGWELGKEDPAYRGNQRFLATGHRRFPIGAWNHVSIRQVGGTVTISVNGRLLARVVDRQRPYLDGRLGLYAEDSRVAFTRIVVRPAR